MAEKKTGKTRKSRITRKRKPKFNVPNLGFFKSVKARWRKPRGTHNKKRMKFKFMGALPKIGYKNELTVRGLHSSGKTEVLVSNLAELDALKEVEVVVRLASALGGKKRKQLEERAKALKLVVLNNRFNGVKEDGKADSSKK
ncbi:MAG: eL32 family ribosomal protein [Candidatus Micrarchaeota archaeon]